MTRTSTRKQQHVNITLKKDVSFHSKSTGFENWDFVHNALPEINLSDVDTSTSFLGKKISLPFIVSSMTGGYAEAEQINRQLAEICSYKKIGMGVGSQRQTMEDKSYYRSFSIVREVAPDIPIFGNIGAVEVAKLRDVSPILRLIDLIQADGFAVHLNPLQELLQPEGEVNFRGVLNGIEMLAKQISIPVIVKEIGAGISVDVAQRLINVGVKIIDVAGAGGTSWAGVEIIRHDKKNQKKVKEKPYFNSEIFWDWGIPTVDALVAISALKKNTPYLKVIASGGITNGIDIAKSIAFNADYTASARQILKAMMNEGKKDALHLLAQWETELKSVMFLTGSRTIEDLQKQKMVKKL